MPYSPVYYFLCGVEAVQHTLLICTAAIGGAIFFHALWTGRKP